MKAAELWTIGLIFLLFMPLLVSESVMASFNFQKRFESPRHLRSAAAREVKNAVRTLVGRYRSCSVSHLDQKRPGPLPFCPDLVWGNLPPRGNARFPNRETLCSAPIGQPLPKDLYPPLPPETKDDPSPMEAENEYQEKLLAFLERRGFDTELGWAGDAHWRLTGDIEGCPCDSTFETFGVHLLVRAWYSPEVVEWLCSDRTTELPEGAAIIKEEHEFQGPAAIVVDRYTREAAPAQELVPALFAVNIKRPEVTWDGYYLGSPDREKPGNPPVIDRAGLTESAPLTLPLHEPPFYPTGASTTFEARGSAVYRLSGYGLYCLNCHSVARSEQTFADIENILGHERIYEWRGRGRAPLCYGKAMTGLPTDPGAGHAQVAEPCPTPFPPPPLSAPDPFFLATFDEVAEVTGDEAWNGVDIAQGTNMPPDLQPLRYPAGQTWDRVVMPPAGHDQIFISSDQCVGCHDGDRKSSLLPNMVVEDKNGRHINLSPGSEWRNSSMGLAGRDPFFMSRMEAEWNRVERQFAKVDGIGASAAPTVADCAMDLCLSCHGKPGHHQNTIDTKGMGTGPLNQLEAQNTYICRDLLPPGLPRADTKDQGSLLFVRPTLQHWPGTADLTDKERRSGNLGREGIACLVCHLASPNVGDPKDGFTGNIPFTIDRKLFGPDEVGDPGKVMERAIGLLPEKGEHITRSKLCGACHAINLPVLKGGNCSVNPFGSPFEGCVEKFAFEQTTYFEYLNSAYNPDSPSAEPGLQQQCQGCHMQNMHEAHGRKPLQFKVANIQDDSFPRYANSPPESQLDLPVRKDYRRHAFPGLNLFLNGFIQQFPLLLGYADFDWMNQHIEMSVLTQRDTLLEFAREKTARVALERVERTSEGLRAEVEVTNLSGHNLPSGVGFRRLFLEVSVIDKRGRVLWMSGRTNRLGQLVDDTGIAFPSENFPTRQYEPHYQVIQSENEVQIYEEIAVDKSADPEGIVTVGFLHRWEVKKDNRILPRGFRWDSQYVEPPYDVTPVGQALSDADYERQEGPLPGVDHITYELSLSPAALRDAQAVRVRLLSQSVPPYFLSQVFTELKEAKKDPDLVKTQNQLIVDGTFLHYLASRFDTSARDRDGEPYLEDWKLEIASDEHLLQRHIPRRSPFWELIRFLNVR